MRLYWEERRVDLPRAPVKESMVAKPVTAFCQTSASEAARLMWKNDFGQLPISSTPRTVSSRCSTTST